jgi:hypothetical protein
VYLTPSVARDASSLLVRRDSQGALIDGRGVRRYSQALALPEEMLACKEPRSVLSQRAGVHLDEEKTVALFASASIGPVVQVSR